MLISFLVVLLLSLTVTTAEKPPPENVAILQVVSNGPALKVTWDPPETSRTIADYQVQYREDSKLAWGDPVSVGGPDIKTFTIEGLMAGTTYAVQVRTVFGNEGVSASDTGPVTQETTFAVPSQVTPLTVTKAASSGKPALNVSWSAPQSDSTITKYELQYKKTPSGDWMSRDVTSTSTSTTLPNLGGGTEYAVRVRAVSGAGEGLFSNTRRQTTFSVPHQVTGVRLSVVSGQAAIQVVWTKPSSDSTIIRYNVQYGPSPAHPNRWTKTVSVLGATSLTTTLTGLGRRSYDVRVAAVSDVGFGWYSATATLSIPKVPSQVNRPTVTKEVSSGKPALTVSWSAPQSDSPITKYEVQYRKTLSSGWMSRNVTSSARSTTLLNLDAGTEYTVRVRAVSGAGDGPVSDIRKQTTFNVPSRVTGVKLSNVSSSSVSGQAAIKVVWTKPSLRDLPIIRYAVQYGPSPARPNGWTNTIQVPGADSLTTTLTGLGRRSYDVRVAAVSGAGFGWYSTTSTQSTARVPSQVTGVSLSVVSGQASIKVTWTKPSSDSAIISYDVHYGLSPAKWSSTVSVQGADSLTTTLTGLGRRSYDVRVLAVSDAGNGDYSAISTLSTARVPSEVTGVMLSVVSGQAAIRVDWAKPNSDQPIIRYEVEYGERGVRWIATVTVQGADSLTTTITNLPRRKTYVVRVRAVSNAGAGIYTEPDRRPTVILPNLPSQVTGVMLSVVSGQAAIRVTWNKPSSDLPIIIYEVEYVISGDRLSFTETVRGANKLTTTTTDLTRGTTYVVRVRAVSGAGNGPYSPTPDPTITILRLPSQVNPPTVTKAVSSGKPALTVSWSAPQSESTITKYELQYRKTLSSGWMSSDVTSRTYTLTNLDAGTEYSVRVRAVSGAGEGPFSNIRMQTTFNVPAVVSDVQVVAEESFKEIQITVSWTPPKSERIITHYSVDYRLGSRAARSFNTTAITYVITGTSGRTYRVRVAAVSDVGPGPWSETVIIAPPSAPTGVIATSIDTSSVTITWNNDGWKYRIFAQREGSSERTSPSPVNRPHTITGLDSNTGYTITVEAYSPLGQAGRNISVSTLPEAPSSLNLEVVSSSVIRVTWTAPPNADRLPLTYLISYQSEFDSGMKDSSTQPVDLTRLHPFAEYTVSVQARNTGGQLSVIVTSKSTTLSAAPSSPPRNIQFVDRLTAHDNITISWRIPRKENRNGIITSYFIIFARVSGGEQQPVGNFTKVVNDFSTNAPKNFSHTLTNLTPDTLYSFTIAAVTSGGIGVFSTSQLNRTALDLYVSMLNAQVNSNTSSTISWIPPVGNPVVSSYTVYYGVYKNTAVMKTTTLTPSIKLSNLTPETPIEVSVIPMTAQGPGGPMSSQFFTREGVPTVPVKNVTVMRINGVSLRVSWTPLSLHEARGWPLYTVIVESTAGWTTRATITCNTSSSTVDVGGLDPCTSYSVRVQVGTSAGTSAALISDPVTAGPGPCPDYTAIIVAVLVVLVIAIIITVVAILFLYRARKKSANSFSPSQSESEVDIKGGKGNSVQMMALSSNSEKQGSMGELHNPTQNGNLEPVTYETVTTSMGAPVDKSDFASHVTMMHKSRDSGFEKEYLSIVNDPEGVEAIAKANKLKNRYINIHTFDHSRVMLNVPDDNGSDYINASYIDGYKRENAYIASQGPTPSTISDFWQMIVDHKAPVVVMLTKVEEKGKKKCEQYWDETLNTKVDKGRGIQVTTVKFTPYADYEVREFQITSSSSPSVQPLKVKHFLYTAWPDHGVPQHPSSLVRFTHKVRRAYQNSAAPIIVHCSAGVGRTGTYLTIDAMMQRIREVADLNIYEFVVEMRSKRTFMVQNQDQYAFIHDALCDHITCGDTSIPAHELRRITIGMEANDPKTNKSGFEQQFEFLDSLSKTPCVEDVKFAKKNTISKKNRHRDRCAYSNNHLHIPGKSASNGSDYINASYVDSYSRKNAFIAAQTPLPSTVADFWELLWQFKPPTVVVLTSADDDKDGADFWPSQEEGVADYGVVKVNHKATMPCSDYDRHSLEVVDKRKDKCTPYNLTLFHFKVWSLDSTPYLPSLLDMMGEVERCHSGSTKSIAVACSDGMSRTGVFISTMSEVERVKTESEVDLFQTIKLARAKRPFMVFTVEQYKLCFDILQAYLDSFDTYANFKVV